MNNKKRKYCQDQSDIYRSIPLEIFFIIAKSLRTTYQTEIEHLRIQLKKEQDQSKELTDAIKQWVETHRLDITDIHDVHLCDIIELPNPNNVCATCFPTCDECGMATRDELTYIDLAGYNVDICDDCKDTLCQRLLN